MVGVRHGSKGGEWTSTRNGMDSVVTFKIAKDEGCRLLLEWEQRCVDDKQKKAKQTANAKPSRDRNVRSGGVGET